MIGRPSDKFMTVYGSVFGDVEELIANRRPKEGQFIELSQDQSAFTVRYDERIFLNIPPGLQELLEISLEEVVR